MRPFALRQRRLIFRSVSAAGSTLLACIFEAIPKPTPGPFGIALPPPSRLFVAVRGTIHVRNPLPSPISELPICDQASAPLRDLSIPQARSAQLDSKQRSLPLRVARFSFAPRCARNNHLFTSASHPCLFAAMLKSPPGPLGAALPPPIRLFVALSARSTCETRCQVRFQNSLFVTKPPLPFRISHSLGFIALNLLPI